MLSNQVKERAWPFVALGKIYRGKDVKMIKQWIRENTGGEYRVRLIRETDPKNNKQSTIATMVRFENEEDCFLFRLTWFNYQ